MGTKNRLRGKNNMRFEKVSFEEFLKDVAKTFGEDETNESFIEAVRTTYEGIHLPKRGTSGSAGYDFYCPFYTKISQGEEVMIPTGIRCKLEEGQMLLFFPRSSMGIKKKMYIANTVPLIDSDYYGSENEGHIFIAIGTRNPELEILENDRFVQGVVTNYIIAEDDETSEKRTCGIGSTGV